MVFKRPSASSLQPAPSVVEGSAVLAKIFLFSIIALSSISFCFADSEKCSSSDCYNNLGRKYSFKEEYDTAIKHFNSAIETSPRNPYPYLNLGIIYKRKKDYNKAIEYLNKAISLKPDLRDAYNVLGQVYELMGDLNSALEYSKKAIYMKEEMQNEHY